MENVKTCAICISPIKHGQYSIIVECSHEFCFDCIDEWARVKINCPLCNLQFHAVHYNFRPDGTSDEKIFEEPPKKKPEEVELDVSGLDFSFFTQEVMRLMANAEALYKLKNESLKSSDPFALQSVNEIIDRLECIKIDLVNERQFDPESLMKNLFAVDGDLKALWNGRPIANSADLSPRKLYGANDDYYSEEKYYGDDYDEYAEDD
eukprot:TRINITY_DN14674_c0_g1_i1.p1 TRINITY_DN14674_c0_g1~~TRINITY_DN14674_c0_g1_i1.p1  ORF type:complete len:207 (-),score=22.04 TRINITY_DN14674_c0_g1_i1:47-667(-)